MGNGNGLNDGFPKGVGVLEVKFTFSIKVFYASKLIKNAKGVVGFFHFNSF